ncbi:MAG: putative toxin-antitoxin system toxin component, PIN family [Synergistaceae bacterium]|nr:putative toxin-antitoxin system toxin component, PIN family [Synergistaceae bacterium]MBQ6969558.1 putative toxin-antitoxin system toxin component, PIN family [Synergistaceae bacterium]
MPYYAVIDTNVIVSALLTKNFHAATFQVIGAVLTGDIIPLYNNEIFSEYSEVLRRDKFNLRGETVDKLLSKIELFGVEVMPVKTEEILVDADDTIFYETVSAFNNAYLITGNKKHFPDVDFVVSPAEMMEILKS